MKKSKLLMPLVGFAAAAATIAPVVTLTSCNKKTEDSTNKVAVIFIPNNGEDPIVKTCARGSTVMLPETPKKSNCYFGGWYLDSAFTKEFDPSETVERNTVVYALWYEGVTYASIPRTLKLPFYDDGTNSYTSSKVFTVYESDGKEKTGLTFYSDNPAVANIAVDADGKYSISLGSGAKGEGEYANIYAYSSGNVIASTKVYPYKASRNVTLDDTYGYAEYDEYLVDEDMNCTLPDTITSGGKDYKISMIDPTDATSKANLLAATSVYLPSKLYALDGVLFGSPKGSALQDVYFNSDRATLKAIHDDADDGWMGKQVISAHCSDGVFYFSENTRKEAAIITDTGRFATPKYTKDAGEQSRNVKARFDFSNMIFNVVAAANHIIEIPEVTYEEGKDYPVIWGDVYLNGKKLSQGSDYTIVRTIGQHPAISIGGTNDITLGNSSNLVVDVIMKWNVAEVATFTLQCQPNAPKELKVKVAPRRHYNKGDKFSISGLKVNAVFNDGTEYEIPNEWLTFYDAAGTKLIPGSTAMAKVNEGKAKMVWEGLTEIGLTALEAEFDIEVTE